MAFPRGDERNPAREGLAPLTEQVEDAPTCVRLYQQDTELLKELVATKAIKDRASFLRAAVREALKAYR